MENSKIIENNSKAIILLQLVIPGSNNQAQLSIRGTGFIVLKDGTFITNAHVYKEIPENQRQYLSAQVIDRVEDAITYYKKVDIEVVRLDEENDIAVMKIKGKDNFIPVEKIGDSEKVREGDELLFMGYPLATELLAMGFGITMSANHCIVSSIKRRMQDKSLHFFMIDTHTNSGSSGSPLFSKSTGEVIGIVSGRISSRVQTDPANQSKFADIPANMGICRPINYLKKLIK
ncbi:MAG: serine protease [Minisyncoccia bacterium]|jgi:S1-C subfamily serine protease